jgi:hypothetical protein
MVTEANAAGNGMRIFLAAPMSGYGSDKMYKSQLKLVLQICNLLEKNSCVESVYFAGRNIGSISDFTDPQDAFRMDYGELQRCDFFILYYPAPVRSSVLVEAGIALGLQKISFYTCQKRSVLPYLLVNAATSSGSPGFPSIGIWEWEHQQPDAEALVHHALAHANVLVET